MLDLDYSDSDASDSEKIATAPPPPAQAFPSPKKPSSLSAFLPKPKSRKHKDSHPDQDRPKKIVVALPKFDDDGSDEDRSAKRARTDGGSGLNAMLPAPKRAGMTKVDSAAMRDIITERISKDTEPEDSQNHNGVSEQEKESDVRKPSTATNPMFVPQSVARKPIQPMSAFKKGPVLKPKSEPTKPKVSLFGSAATTNKPQPKVNRLKVSGEYKPIMVEAAKPLPKQEDDAEYVEEFSYLDNGATSLQPNTCADPSSISQPVDDLDTLARGAGLDEQAMRQLYGRNGPGREAIKVSTFSVDDEYKQNELERSLGLVQDAKPVRSVAPGRHQLQSLLNNAQSQRTALEDSFARGKSNRKEAGSKYGW